MGTILGIERAPVTTRSGIIWIFNILYCCGCRQRSPDCINLSILEWILWCLSIGGMSHPTTGIAVFLRIVLTSVIVCCSRLL
jgi:hypothetical protein